MSRPGSKRHKRRIRGKSKEYTYSLVSMMCKLSLLSKKESPKIYTMLRKKMRDDNGMYK